MLSGRYDVTGVAHRDQILERGLGGRILRIAHPGDEPAAVVSGLPHQAGELVVVDQARGLLPGHDVGDLGTGESGVQT